MAGGIIFVIVMVFVVPAAVMIVGMAWSAVFGWLFPADEATPSDTPPSVEPTADVSHA